MQGNEAMLVLFYNTVTKNVNSYILSKWPPGAPIWKYLLPDRGVIYSQRILQFHLPWIHSTSSEWLSVEYYYNLCVSLHSFTLLSLQLLEPKIPLKTDKMTLRIGTLGKAVPILRWCQKAALKWCCGVYGPVQWGGGVEDIRIHSSTVHMNYAGYFHTVLPLGYCM